MKIAVVEDDPEIRSALSTMLTQRLGYPKPSVFGDGTSLVKAIASDHQSFDLIIMDYRMPEMNGIEAARIILRHRNGIKVVLITGYDVKEEAESAGMIYLQKPFSIEALTTIIQQVNLAMHS